MDIKKYCLELSVDPIRFEPVSQLTNIFFDDSNRQVFGVRSGGATGIVVKGPTENQSMTFCMVDKGTIQSIKFCPDNKILAIQREKDSVEFICFNKSQPVSEDPIVYKAKNSPIFGFVWTHQREVAIFSQGGIELYNLNLDKRTLKLVKSLNLTINRFAWCPAGNFALLTSCNGAILTPVIIKQGTINKLQKVDMTNERKLIDRDITLAVIYGTGAILFLHQTQNTRLVEVVVYLLNGPGLAPRKCHILRLGHSGRFAMNVIDDLIIVHHQDTKTSLIFDISLSGESDPIDKVTRHSPLAPGKPMKPFQLKLPSISADGAKLDCELYSPRWVLFQPNIVIDIELGCMWSVVLNLESLCHYVADKVRLVEFLLQRTNGKQILISVLQEMVGPEYKTTVLPILESVFDKLNNVYKNCINLDIQNKTAMPSSAKPIPKSIQVPRVLIDQTDMHCQVLTPISSLPQFGNIVMIYLNSLTKYDIIANYDLSKMIVSELINSKQFGLLQDLVTLSLIESSKALAISLLSLSNLHPSIGQIVLDMLAKLNETEIIIEVLLEQGNVMDALRMAKSQPSADHLPARKYLEAAFLTNDSIIFHSVYAFFQQRNTRLRGNPDFLRSEQCEKYIKHYQQLFYS